MNKDVARSDPAEGSREVIERELRRQERKARNARPAGGAGKRQKRSETKQ